MKGGTVDLELGDGSARTLTMEERTTMYLRGGAYLGYKDAYHGLWLGHEWSDGERWNVADQKIANEVHGLNDAVIEVRCGDEVGYGIIENLVLPPFPRYGF